MNEPSQPAVLPSEPEGGWVLIAFFAITYGVLWICFFSVAAMPSGASGRAALLFIGPFAPSMAAIFLAARGNGWEGVRELLRPVVQWQVRARWYVFAVAYMAAVKVTVAVLHRAMTGAWPRFGTDLPVIILLAILVSTPFQAGEEIGWRGYALPRLAVRFGLARASVLLGVIWACWHLPQFFIREADTYGQSFGVYVLQVTALSVAFAWLWSRTNGSLLLPMLLHAAVNNSKDIVPSATAGARSILGLQASLVAWLTVILLWTCAAYFLVRMSANVSRGMPGVPGRSRA